MHGAPSATGDTGYGSSPQFQCLPHQDWISQDWISSDLQWRELLMMTGKTRHERREAILVPRNIEGPDGTVRGVYTAPG